MTRTHRCPSSTRPDDRGLAGGFKKISFTHLLQRELGLASAACEGHHGRRSGRQAGPRQDPTHRRGRFVDEAKALASATSDPTKRGRCHPRAALRVHVTRTFAAVTYFGWPVGPRSSPGTDRRPTRPLVRAGLETGPRRDPRHLKDEDGVDGVTTRMTPLASALRIRAQPRPVVRVGEIAVQMTDVVEIRWPVGK